MVKRTAQATSSPPLRYPLALSRLRSPCAWFLTRNRPNRHAVSVPPHGHIVDLLVSGYGARASDTGAGGRIRRPRRFRPWSFSRPGSWHNAKSERRRAHSRARAHCLGFARHQGGWRKLERQPGQQHVSGFAPSWLRSFTLAGHITGLAVYQRGMRFSAELGAKVSAMNLHSKIHLVAVAIILCAPVASA